MKRFAATLNTVLFFLVSSDLLLLANARSTFDLRTTVSNTRGRRNLRQSEDANSDDTTNEPTVMVDCEKIITYTNEIGKLSRLPDDNLGFCRAGKSVDIDSASASAGYIVKGGDLGGFTYFVLSCKADSNSVNTVVVKSRPEGSTGPYDECHGFRSVTCENKGDNTRVSIRVKPDTEYFFLLTAHGGDLGDHVSVNSKCLTSEPTVEPTPEPSSAPTFAPTALPTTVAPSTTPVLPPPQECSTVVNDNTKTIGKLPSSFNAFGQCGNTKIDLENCAASKAYRAIGGATGGKTVFLVPCFNVDNTSNHILVYSRPSDQTYDNINDGFRCDNVKSAQCSKVGPLALVDQTLLPNREYLFIVGAQGDIQGQEISVTTQCNAPKDNDNNNIPDKPTFKPSLRPTARPTSSPSQGPTETPTLIPTPMPTLTPTTSPSSSPSSGPTVGPTASPSSIASESEDEKPTACVAKPGILDFEGLPNGMLLSRLPGVTVNGRGPSSSTNAAMVLGTQKDTNASKEARYKNRGNVCIISEDGDQEHPVDSTEGGTIFLHFDGYITLDSFLLVGAQDDEVGRITLFDPLNRIVYNSPFSGNGVDSQTTIDVGGVPNVHSVVIRLSGSAAIDDVKYTIECSTAKEDSSNEK
eukprot:CAMPEP_0118675276 /NCGR_PEP_ID=MMETSP0800-20121206/1362_1 /TAXON_ID=210618 ORGANISM="Striatella unipunctata, Strain CCMP2910" /NCGR_SAMPLE_ID=MMETSP0800 /ASSEMBLY_ACC=CAM_ASM_000638 /LENGTH=636 /DNA_ID=CAMNT_0006570581 /DNA_START=151 /DNA_END=2061 /DNA_ORIENTATION=-